MTRGKPISSEIRKIIINSWNKGKNDYKIAKDLFLSRASVQNIINQFKKTQSIVIKKSTGRPSTFSERDYRCLEKLLKSNRRDSCVEIAEKWRKKCNRTISAATVTRSIKKIGYGFYKVIW